MGAEIGATTSLFPFNKRMGDYLRATGRADVAADAEKNMDLLTPDAGAPYDQVSPTTVIGTSIPERLGGRRMYSENLLFPI